MQRKYYLLRRLSFITSLTARDSQHAIPGPADSGRICANGACCHKINVKDKVIICSYTDLNNNEIENHKPTILYLNDNNEIVDKNKSNVKLA